MGDSYRILVTGEHEELGHDEATFQGKKIEWVQVPVLRFEKLPIAEEVVEAFLKTPVQWILFTSPRAVKFWTETLLEQAVDFPIETQVACIGETTADAAGADGFTADFYPTEPGTEKFLEEFEHLLSNNSEKPSVLIPMAEGGRTAIRDRLLELGCRVTVLPLYRTLAREDVPKILSQEELNHANSMLFTSPSSVDAVTKHFKLPPQLKIVAMGKFTADYLEKKGFGKAAVLPEGDFKRIGEVLC